MIIVSKDKTSLANINHVASIYVAGDYSIKANMNGNTSMIKLGAYMSQRAAERAFRLLVDALSGGRDICYMPTDDEVNAAFVLDERRHRNIGGKKTKGHGGS